MGQILLFAKFKCLGSWDMDKCMFSYSLSFSGWNTQFFVASGALFYFKRRIFFNCFHSFQERILSSPILWYQLDWINKWSNKIYRNLPDRPKRLKLPVEVRRRLRWLQVNCETKEQNAIERLNPTTLGNLHFQKIALSRWNLSLKGIEN